MFMQLSLFKLLPSRVRLYNHYIPESLLLTLLASVSFAKFLLCRFHLANSSGGKSRFLVFLVTSLKGF